MVKSAILAVLLLGAASASPLTPSSKPRYISKRITADECTEDTVAAEVGQFFAVDQGSGLTVDCDTVNELKTSDGFYCYRKSADEDSLGDLVKCPQDPAPSKNPDGSDAPSVADGFIQTYCDIAGDGGLLPVAFANTIGCLLFGYYEAQGNPIAEVESGAMGICDTIFSGACTWFTEIGPEIAAGMDRPCVDDPGSNACAFANPGKA